MAQYLTDDEVFGTGASTPEAGPTYLSDDEVFGATADAQPEQEVVGDDRGDLWRSRSIFKGKPTAGAGRGSAEDPRRLDREPPPPESRWAQEVRSNLPTIDSNLKLSAPEPQKPAPYKSVLDGVQMTGGGFDAREAERLSQRDYAERAERAALYGRPAEMRATVGATGRQAFTEANPVAAGFAQSAANTIAGTLNAPAVAAGLVNENLVRPVSRAIVGALDGDESLLPGRVGNAPLVDSLKAVGADYTSRLSRKSPGAAWDDGEFGHWLVTQMSGNSFSAAQSLGALFVPGAQASLLASMGAVSAGNAYAEGDSAQASFAKGLVESGSEMLPLKAAEKIKDLVLAIPAPMRQRALAEIGKRSLAAGAAITSNALVGSLEEVVAAVGGNAVDKLISGKDKSLFEDVDRAAIVGAAFGGAMSAPAVGQTLARNTDPAAQALTDALNQGQFDPASAATSVDNALRTQPGTSNAISPAATSQAAAMAERARLEQMRAKPTVADIGKAGSVDEAIAVATQAAAAPVAPVTAAPTVDAAIGQAMKAIDPAAPAMPAATRPVQLDEQALLAQAMAGIPAAEQATGQAARMAPAAEQPATQSNQPADQPVKTWFGRRGDGYATPEDASRGLNERRRLQPSLNWNVEQMPDGRYRLAGYAAPATQNGAPAGVAYSGKALGAVPAQNTSTQQGATDVPILARPSESVVWGRRADGRVDPVLGQAVEQLALASGRPGAIQLVSRDAALRQLDAGAKARAAQGLPQIAGATDANEVLTGIEQLLGATAQAFGDAPTMVTGLPNAFGVQHNGRAYLDVARLARGDRTGNPLKALFLFNAGHEVTHSLEKSSNPQDRADYAALRAAILGNAKPDRLAARIQDEGQGKTYGENEVVADVSGGFWLDSKFWERLHAIDGGSTMRRIAYKFMESATKLIDAIKGSRLDPARFIENVDEVREVAAQVWARKAQRDGALFAYSSTNKVASDVGAGDNARQTTGARDGQQASGKALAELQGLSADRGGVQRVPERMGGAAQDGAADQYDSDGGRRGSQGGGSFSRAEALEGSGRGLKPLPGYSVNRRVGVSYGPDPALVAVAERYASDNGINLKRQSEYVAVSTERAKRIADAYGAMAHAPADPAVRAAYADLIRQTRAQYDALVDAGYRFRFFGNDSDPYNTNPWAAMRELRTSKSMAVYATSEGFGSDANFDPANNPLLAETGLMWDMPGRGAQPVLANDLFRAVHDAFGHGLEGAGFRAQGEENAWQAHVRLFTGAAVGAITSETRGQNSFLNFGPDGAANRAAGLFDTKFADQKTGLMPEWTWMEGRAGDAVSYSRAGISAEVAPDPRDAKAKERWDALTPEAKAKITRQVIDRIAPKVFDHMGLSGWDVDYVSGLFEGDINPSAYIRAAKGATAEQLNEAMRVFGYLLDQKGMVAFDESDTSSGTQAGFVKVVLPEGLSTDRIDAIRREIAARVPQVGGDTVRDGAIVYGNFSQWGDAPLTDAEFRDAIFAAADAMPEQLDVAGPFVFHSEYMEAYEGQEYQPEGREAYLEGTKYASNEKAAEAGRDGVRGRSGSDVSRAWIRSLARDIGTRIATLVADGQPRRAYGADARADRAGPAAPAKPGGLYDGRGRSDAQSGGGSGVVAVPPDGRTGQPPRYGRAIEGATSAVGYHFSKVARTSLNGAFYGTGLQGAEAKRLNAPENADIKQRVFFYVDAGRGVRPEAGVGGIAHHVQLDNLYDVTADPLRIARGAKGATPEERASNLERAIVDAGFDGYIRRDPIDPQHYAVLVGKRHSAVPVTAANPRRADGKANLQPVDTKPKAEVTRKIGDELVRRPVGAEVMEIIKAQRAGLDLAAPSFKMQFGEARVLESEAATADAVFEEQGAKFRFGSVSYSWADMDDVNELGAFDLDAIDLDAFDAKLADVNARAAKLDPVSDEFMAELQREMDAERGRHSGPVLDSDEVAPDAGAIAEAGLLAENAFDFSGNFFEREGGLPTFVVPSYIAGIDNVEFKGGREGGFGATVSGGRSVAGAYSSFVSPARAHPLTLEQIKTYVSRQAAGYHLKEIGHDIASAYRKGKILQIANAWREIAKVGGAFKLPDVSGSADFAQVAKDMGAFKGYEVESNLGSDGFGWVKFKAASGVTHHADVSGWGGRLQCCTMGLAGGGGLGSEFYAVLAVVAKNMGKRFVADDFLSGINSYRRTEQAFSYAIKTGDTGVLLPGGQNRVYGYNQRPETQEDHDKNIARLALAGMRNVQEIFPDVRRYSYDAQADVFTDSQGRNADAVIDRLLKEPEARAFGLGRSTVARAVLTSQIIKGDLDVKAIKRIAKPVAYSMADAELDQPLGEGWGDPGSGLDGLNPNLRRFMSGSKIVNKDGVPRVMYHGTGQDIHAFRAKQAGAIFVTPDPDFADQFAATSKEWMANNPAQSLEPALLEQAKKQAAAAVMADKSIKMTERKAMKQSIMDGNPEGAAKDAMGEAVANLLQTGENIIPVVVRATAPFDFSAPGHVQDVIYTLQERQGVEDGGDVTIQLVKDGGDRVTVSEADLEIALRSGMWEYIESPEIQAVIRDDLGHDGFWVKEWGVKNLAVYQPSQLKSVFNHGAYDPNDDRLSYSRAALDDYMVRRNKSMPTISGAAAQEADIALAVKAIEAVQGEIERGNKASLPIPLGRTPHVLGMFRAPNKMLRIDTSILKKVLFDKHSEDFADVSAERFVRAIYQPAMVLRGRSAGEFEIVTDIVTKRGPILIPVMTGGNSPSAAVMSAYAKNVNGAGESLMKRINSGALLYADPVLAQSALTGRNSAPARGIITREAQFSSAPPRGAQPVDGNAIESGERIQGITTSGAQFPSAPPRRAQGDNVNQPGDAVKPLNPHYAGWAQVRDIIIGGIRERKVKSDVDLMRRIGDLYKGDWTDAPSFSKDDISPLGYYSALTRGIDGLKSSAAPAAGWKDAIKGLVNKGQAKADEVEWSGVNDWLDLQQGRVTKEQVLEYLRGNGVQVQEVVLGNPNGFTQDMQERLDDLEYRIASLTDEEESERQRLISAENRASDEWGDTNQTKYGSYTLPGGENYREVLLTLPMPGREAMMNRSTSLQDELRDLRRPRDMANETAEDFENRYNGDRARVIEAEIAGLRQKLSKQYEGQYRSSHWDQFNILAHIRANDRTDADGKRVLFVEEIQSDWGQDGKKKGIAKSYKPEDVQPLSAVEAGKMTVADEELFWHFKTPDNIFSIPKSKHSDRDAARDYIIREKKVNSGGVPDAPFIGKTEGWLNLALKRVITMAVDGGYDKVAFVTGQQSAERYDLSKQISRVEFSDASSGSVSDANLGAPDGYGNLSAFDLDGKRVIDTYVSVDKIEDYVGKEVARKLLESEPKAVRAAGVGLRRRSLDGLDLKVGGEGMKAFYDTIVPNAVKALVKKLGGVSLEQVTVGDDLIDVYDKQGRLVAEAIGRDEYEGAWEGAKHDGRPSGKRLEQPGFTITPAMREKVADGLPSFSRANGGFDLPDETIPQSLRRKGQDFFLRAQVVQEAVAKQGGKVDEKTDFYRAEELSHGRMGSLLQDFANNQVQPLMEKLVKMGIDLDELSLYAYAKHAPERNREIAKINKAMPDGGSGMTNAEAAGILQLVDLSGDKAKFEELHADLMAITSTNRLAMLADGLITQEEFNALEGQYENYIPLRGFEVMEDGEKPAGRPAGRGFNIRGKETLRALGRRTRAAQLIENVIGDYQRTVVRGERNHVAKVFLNFVLQNPDPDLWEIDAQRTRLALDRQTGRVVKNTLIDKGEDTISVKVAGQEIYIKIKDPLLLRAMRKQHASDMGEQHRVLVSALGLYTTLLRNTLTRYNPEFALVNAMRDVGFGALAAFDEMGAGGLARYMGNYAGATAASFRAERNTADPQGNRWDRTLSEYKAAGGATSGFYAKDLEGISSDIRGMMIEAGAAPNGWTERARHNVVTKQVARFGRVLEFAGSVSENAARVAAYKTARDMGKSPSQAASIAKNLTTNFDRKGEWGATLNAAYVFFNAAVQGSHRTLKMFANPKVSGVLLGTAVAGVQLALYAAAAGGDDPDDGIAYWDKIPAHVKERNLIIMLPPGAVMDGAEQVGTNGRYISIPIQYGLNIFPLLGYQIADVLRNQKDKTRGVTVQKAAIAMASAIAGSFNPLGGAVDLTSGSSVMQAVAPSIFDPVIQGATGTNAFGREVAPFKSPFDTKPDSQNSNVRQAGGPAEAVARWINSVSGGSEYGSGAIDLSPGTVENVVRNLTGGTGMFLYDVVALAGKQIDEFNGEAPERFTKDIPVWRRVRGDIDGDVDQGIFYENRRKIQEARGIQKRMEDSGDDVELTGEKAELAGMDKGANKTTRALSKIRKQIAEIKRDADISDTERAVRIRELQAERDALVNEFNRDFMETMREYFEASSGVNQ